MTTKNPQKHKKAGGKNSHEQKNHHFVVLPVSMWHTQISPSPSLQALWPRRTGAHAQRAAVILPQTQLPMLLRSRHCSWGRMTWSNAHHCYNCICRAKKEAGHRAWSLLSGQKPLPLSANHWGKGQSHSSENPNTPVTATWDSEKARETSYYPHRHSQGTKRLCCAPVAEHIQWWLPTQERSILHHVLPKQDKFR